MVPWVRAWVRPSPAAQCGRDARTHGRTHRTPAGRDGRTHRL